MPANAYPQLPDDFVAAVRELDFEFEYYQGHYDPWSFTPHEILEAVVPSVFATRIDPGDAAVELGRSKVGGAPDLPAEMPWPTCEGWAEPGEEGPPLAFIAQINLAEVSAHDPSGRLPTSGMFYLFCIPDGDEAYSYALDGSGGNVQFFWSDGEPVDRRAPPAELVEPVGSDGSFAESSLSFHTGYCVDHPEMALDIRGTVERMLAEHAPESGGFQLMLGPPFIFDEDYRDWFAGEELLLGLPAYDFDLHIFGESEFLATSTSKNIDDGHFDRISLMVLPGT